MSNSPKDSLLADKKRVKSLKKSMRSVASSKIRRRRLMRSRRRKKK